MNRCGGSCGGFIRGRCIWWVVMISPRVVAANVWAAWRSCGLRVYMYLYVIYHLWLLWICRCMEENGRGDFWMIFWVRAVRFLEFEKSSFVWDHSKVARRLNEEKEHQKGHFTVHRACMTPPQVTNPCKRAKFGIIYAYNCKEHIDLSPSLTRRISPLIQRCTRAQSPEKMNHFFFWFAVVVHICQ